MNDEFMIQLVKVPRAEFANALYERISRQPESRFANKLTFRNVVIGFALMFVVAACVYAVVERGWRKVGDFWVDVETTHKVQLSQPVPVTSEELETQHQNMGCVPLEEARATLSFDLRVPDWAPEGYTFDDVVCGVDWMGKFANLYWKNTNAQFVFIQFMAFDQRQYYWDTQDYKISEPIIGPVAPGSYEEVLVNGQPAVLVRGDWDYLEKDFEPSDQAIQTLDSKWNSKLGIQLYWMDGEVMYDLYAPADVSAEDLIRMAESAQ